MGCLETVPTGAFAQKWQTSKSPILLDLELVGERGFEPPTPWSRTRFQHLLEHVEN
jgi:hypothetical protein